MNKEKFLENINDQIELNNYFIKVALSSNEDNEVIRRCAIVGTLEALKSLIESGMYDKEESIA
jgi:hypothetical protein